MKLPKYKVEFSDYTYKTKYGINRMNAMKGLLEFLLRVIEEDQITNSQLNAAFKIIVEDMHFHPTILSAIFSLFYDNFDCKYKTLSKNPQALLEESSFINIKELENKEVMQKYYMEFINSKFNKTITKLIKEVA